jgi:hypothetical protein
VVSATLVSEKEELLLVSKMYALKRCTQQAHQIGACAVFVEPKDESARQFYLKFGFRSLPDQNKMFITMQNLIKIYSVFH